MSYIEQCLKDHIDGMKRREERKDDAIGKLQAELQTLKDERIELENGVDNWAEEEANL